MTINDVKNTIEKLLTEAIDGARASGALDVPPQTPQVETPRDPSHGDFSTNAAMVLTKQARRKPRDIAEVILENLDAPEDLFANPPEVVGPGFINFRLSPATWLAAIPAIIEAGGNFGKTDVGAGEKVMVEFVSANPTGPLHIGHARNAAIGDTYARILSAAGFDVYREFYLNDAGAQVEVLARTLHARILEARGKTVDWEKTFPDGNYYPGDYILDIAQKAIAELGDIDRICELPAGEYDPAERELAVREMTGEIRRDLEDFAVNFDNWFSEKQLYDKGLSGIVIEKLRRLGDIYEKDGAVWFNVAKYQPDEEDRVVRKSSGEWTYFASDIAYHFDKLERGFQRLVNVWGADHHGYIGRVKASLEALGLPPEKLEILLVQMVSLVRGGEPVRMGKRTGTFVTLREVMDEVGKDAMRFTLLTRSSNSHLEFDLDILSAKPGEDSELKMSQLREKNPVYYVQYAHARCCSILRRAKEQGVQEDAHPEADLSLLTCSEEIDLARKMEGFPRTVAMAALAGEPHRISHYLTDIAGDFHKYYYKGDKEPAYRVLSENIELRAARLALVAATGQVLRNGLDLLGVSAPERM